MDSMVAGAALTGAGAIASVILGGGELQKASLVVVRQDQDDSSVEELVFPINPASVTMERVSREIGSPTAGGSENRQQTASQPLTISFTAHFDTYETRKDVRTEYISKLEEFAQVQPGLHKVVTLHFVWGNLSSQSSGVFDLESFRVTYSMFLPDGTPVRCSVDLTLTEVVDPDEEGRQRESPDHAKVYVVRRGDTLQSIAQREYDDPAEWRRIADANDIDDPMYLRAGTRLLVPPILR